MWIIKIGENIKSKIVSSYILNDERKKMSIFRLGLSYLRNALISIKSVTLKDSVQLLSYSYEFNFIFSYISAWYKDIDSKSNNSSRCYVYSKELNLIVTCKRIY